MNGEFLLECWYDLNHDAASGVDKVTAAEYSKNPRANIEDLVQRLKRKRYRAKLVRHSYTWEQFKQVLAAVNIVRPQITEIKRRRVFA